MARRDSDMTLSGVDISSLVRVTTDSPAGRAVADHTGVMSFRSSGRLSRCLRRLIVCDLDRLRSRPALCHAGHCRRCRRRRQQARVDFQRFSKSSSNSSVPDLHAVAFANRDRGFKMRSPTVPRRNPVNVMRKIASRETSYQANRSFARSSAHEKFKGFELCVSPISDFSVSISTLDNIGLHFLQAELDTHDPKASQLKLNFLKKRSKVSSK